MWPATAIGDTEALVRVSRQLIDAMPAQPSDEYLASLAYPIGYLRRCNHYAESQSLDQLFESHLRARTPGLILAATRARMNGTVAALDGRLDSGALAMKQAVALWTRLGSQRHACLDGGNVGWLLCELGQYEQGIEALRSSVARARRTGLVHVRLGHETSLAIALARSGNLSEAGRLFHELESAENDLLMDANCGIYRAQFALQSRQAGEAIEHIARVLTIIERDTFPHAYAFAMGVRARALLVLDRAAEALSAADQAMEVLDAIGAIEEGDALVRLGHAEALHAKGRANEAGQAIARARRRLLERAERISSAEWRQSFLERVEEHRRTLELADAWLVVQETGQR
jgi:tetratricopeptide (TPR) repeat protein